MNRMRVFLTSASPEAVSPDEALHDIILIFNTKKLIVLIRHAFVLLFYNCKNAIVDEMDVRVPITC